MASYLYLTQTQQFQGLKIVLNYGIILTKVLLMLPKYFTEIKSEVTKEGVDNLKKILNLFLILILLTVYVVPAEAIDDTFYEDFGPFFNVELDKDWTIVFNHSDIENHVNVWIEDSSRVIVPTKQRIEIGNKLIVEPINEYKENEEYTLYIARTSSNRLKRQQKIIFTTKLVNESVFEVEKRKAEINQYWDSIKPIHEEISYIQKPSTVFPYLLGKLSDETVNSALDITNFIRFVAHLPGDVKLNGQFNIEAQAASVVNAANKTLNHYPQKPIGMDEELYELGYKGASTSNIGIGYITIIDSIINGYMKDGDPGNIDRVGHRLWILSPKLKEVGFGYATVDKVGYTAMKVMADDMYWNSHEPYEYISWPAGIAMPIEFFDDTFPWSISLNPDIYDNFRTSNIEVELTRLNDNKTWKLSYNSQDGYFNVSTASYGYLPFTIIFRPDDINYENGDRYKVTIYNLKKSNGDNATISFETTFFDLDD